MPAQIAGNCASYHASLAAHAWQCLSSRSMS